MIYQFSFIPFNLKPIKNDLKAKIEQDTQFSEHYLKKCEIRIFFQGLSPPRSSDWAQGPVKKFKSP